jgi:hypothetical protein
MKIMEISLYGLLFQIEKILKKEFSNAKTLQPYFDLTIVLVVFIVACIGKILGAGLGAAASGIEGKKGHSDWIWTKCSRGNGNRFSINSSRLRIDRRARFCGSCSQGPAHNAISGLSIPWLMKTRPISQRSWDPLPPHEKMGSYNYLESKDK